MKHKPMRHKKRDPGPKILLAKHSLVQWHAKGPTCLSQMETRWNWIWRATRLAKDEGL